jgi:hypothetical protein
MNDENSPFFVSNTTNKNRENTLVIKIPVYAYKKITAVFRLRLSITINICPFLVSVSQAFAAYTHQFQSGKLYTLPKDSVQVNQHAG